jgi:hypothetical protein
MTMRRALTEAQAEILLMLLASGEGRLETKMLDGRLLAGLRRRGLLALDGSFHRLTPLGRDQATRMARK